MGAERSRKLTTISTISIALFFSLIAGIVAHAQVTGAMLSGTVTDPSGGVVAAAQISIKDNATGIVREVTSDTAGLYSAPNLAPGDYEVRVSASGFSTAVQSNLTLAVGAQQQLNFALKVGAQSQTVQVTEAAPQVELTSSTLTGQVESETVRELPLNGRDWTSLAVLQPGVKPIETQMSYDTAARGNRGFGSEMTVSGQRSTFNNYRIDGISVNDYAMASPGNVIGVVLGVDAVQEFSVLTGGFPAEYGRATGGVVNAISKSGTNNFHGDAYEFLRNSALDANDYFTKSSGATIPEFQRNQFGVAAGGPILKDRLFIFGDYEGLRQNLGVPTSIIVPSDGARQGILVGPGQAVPAGNTGAGTTCTTPNGNPGTYPSGLSTVCVDNYTEALINGMYPHANAAISGNTGRFVFAGLQKVPENFYTTRVDYKLGNNDTLFGTYLFDDTDYTEPDKDNDVIDDSHTTRTTVALEETHTFSSGFLNVARIGYNRDHVLNDIPLSAVSAGGADMSLGSTLGETAPRVTVSGLADIFGGVGAGSNYKFSWNSYQAYDDAFWTHGKHTIKFGGGVEWMPFDFDALQEPGGRWKFAGLENYLEGIPTSWEAGLPNTFKPHQFRQTLFGAYIQDDWKLRSNLTINLGLRYEMTTTLKDSQGKIGSLENIVDPSATSSAPSDLQCQTNFTGYPGVTPQPGTSCDSAGSYYRNPTLHNFEPRLGFAWDPFHDGKTSVRGGFGIYDVLPLPGYFILQQNQDAPFAVFKSIGTTALSAIPGPFQAGEGQTILENSTASRLSASTIETDPHRSYVMQRNLTIQRQITSDTTLTVGYVGSNSVHLLMRGDDGNMTQPTLTSSGYEFPCGFVGATDTSCTPGTTGGVLGTGGAASAQLNQALGVIRYIYWNTTANYNALTANLQKVLKHGIQYQVAYTFSKSLDDDSQSIAGDSFANGLNSPMWMIPKAFYGPSDFNVTHTLSINGLWDIPTPRSWQGALNEALGGWELGSILTFNSGTPTTPEIAGDPMGLGNTGADQFGLPDYTKGCNPTPYGISGSTLGAPQWINVSCYSLPMVTTAQAASLPYPCGNFSGAPTPPAGMEYCANLQGNTARNSVYGPRFFNLDFAILKSFPIRRISESFNLQFRAEMFDITNHANFSPPQPGSGDANSQIFNTDGSPSGLGQISQYATQTPSRQIQFALKVNW